MYRVFVYGTLRSGHRNHQRFMQKAVLVGNAEAAGLMYDLGGFPGAKFVFTDVNRAFDASIIKGEVYDVDKETLENLDMLEGYRQGRPRGLNMYERVEIPVEVDGKYQQVLAYEYNGERGLSKSNLIKSGDYNKLYGKAAERSTR